MSIACWNCGNLNPDVYTYCYFCHVPAVQPSTPVATRTLGVVDVGQPATLAVAQSIVDASVAQQVAAGRLPETIVSVTPQRAPFPGFGFLATNAATREWVGATACAIVLALTGGGETNAAFLTAASMTGGATPSYRGGTEISAVIGGKRTDILVMLFTNGAPPGGGGGLAPDAAITSSLSLGPTPVAAAGVLRIGNARAINARNAANSADVLLCQLDAANVCQLSPDVGISSSLALGAGTRAASGELRLANVGAVKARNAANSADVALLSLDASNVCQLAPDVAITTTLRLGSTAVAGAGLLRTPYTAGASPLWVGRASDNSDCAIVRAGSDAYFFGSVGSTNVCGAGVSLCTAADAPILTVGANVKSNAPIIGDSTPYGAVNGHADIAMGAANYTLSAAEYSLHSHKMTGTIGAARNVVVPVATNGQAYIMRFQNATTGGFNIVITTGAGTTVALGAGGNMIAVLVNAAGCTLCS